MSVWTSGDRWMLCCHLLYGLSTDQSLVLLKQRELVHLKWCASPDGKRELEARFVRYLTSKRDLAFQVFKAKVPGLIQPKRGRKPKASAQGEQQ